MKKVIYTALICMASLSFTSCETFMQGMAAGMGGYGYGTGYGTGYMPSYGGGGNMNYLLDPNYAIMQVSQQQAQMNAVNEQLISNAIQKMNDAEQEEYQAAKRYRPNLTLEQFRLEKAQAYQLMNSSENTSSSSYETSTTSQNCIRCKGSGRQVYETNPVMLGSDDYKVKCDECGQKFLKSVGHTHISCKLCGGTGKRR